MNIRINDVKNFALTSQCKTMIEAAMKLQISQPALSESIKTLEQSVGLILFYRSRNGIKLTVSGREFQKKAIQIMHNLNDLKNGNLQSNESQFPIKFGCHPALANVYLPQALKYLNTQCGDFKLELIHDNSRNILSKIQNGEIDIGIVVNPVGATDIVLKKIQTDIVTVWCKNKKTESDLLFCDLNLFQTQSILKKWKNKPSRIIQTNQLDLIARFVNEGLGYGILPNNAVKDSQFNLITLSNAPTIQDEIYLVYRPEFGRTKYEKLILKSITFSQPS